MKILVTGAHGQLGCELRRCMETMQAEIGPIPAEYEGAEVDYVDRDVLDVADREAVASFVDGAGYDMIVNCAAFTNVDGCEADEDAAYAVNATGAENLALAAEQVGAKLVHVSTDYVFPGSEPGERGSMATWARTS